MKFNIINIANKMPAWVNNACEEYLRRINIDNYSCKIIDIRAQKLPNKTIKENLELEAQKINTCLSTNSYIIVLDERGKELTSLEFSKLIETISNNYSAITFIIGSASGTSETLKKNSNSILKLSSLTFPHALVRIIILEQIYRAISIIKNHPYHRE